MNKYKLLILSIYYYILYLITPKSKLKVLYYATFYYLKHRNDYGLTMRNCIIRGLRKVYSQYHYYITDDYIPEFNNYNARALFNGKGGFYWWDLDNIKDRYNYFKWLIKIYKNKQLCV